MAEAIRNIGFSYNKYPDLEFEILPFEKIMGMKGLDHSPIQAHRVRFSV